MTSEGTLGRTGGGPARPTPEPGPHSTPDVMTGQVPVESMDPVEDDVSEAEGNT